MKSLLTKIKSYLGTFLSYVWANKKRPKVFIPFIIIAIILIMTARSGAKAGDFELYTVTPKEFVQEVSVTGKVTPAQKVDMSFEVSGKIKEIKTTVGAKVKKGDVLAELSNLDYVASVSKSQASYLSEQSKLADLQNGSRPAELRIAASDVDTAIQNLEQSRTNVVEQIKDSFAKADDAIKNKADKVIKYPQSVRPELTFFVDGNPALKNTIEFERLKINEMYPKWLTLVATVNKDNLDDAKVAEAKEYLRTTQTFLTDLNTALSLMGDGVRDESANVLLRADISTARLNVNTATQALNAAVNTYQNNVSAVQKAQDQLQLLREGNTAEAIAAQRAQAQSAAAGVSSAAASLNKTRLIAPFDGIVTRIAYKTGESVAQTDVVVTLMSDAAFEVETFVSENDAPKLKIGQKASVTLDALGEGIVFEALISEVDLSETIKDGVVTYKTRIQFISQDERIKSGLTANVTVESDRRADILKVPQSALVIQKGKKFVKQVADDISTWNPAIDKTAKLVPVSTGGIDREGDIEILQGLVSGNKVIIKADK
ncbi:MAG: hypothetical protein RIQ72_307 [Candidatus Parcubacteria bacterium]